MSPFLIVSMVKVIDKWRISEDLARSRRLFPVDSALFRFSDSFPASRFWPTLAD